MVKPNVIKLRELQEEIVEIVNKSEVTPHELLPIFENVTSVIRGECEREYQLALKEYEESLEESDHE